MDSVEARLAIAKAITGALEASGRSQSWLGGEVAGLEGMPDPYAQSSVSKWLSGETELPPQRVFIIEKVFGRRPGTFSRLGGYLPADARAVTSVTDAVDNDPNLSPEARHIVLAAYRAAVKASDHGA